MPQNPPGLYYLTVIGEIHGQATMNGFHFYEHELSNSTGYQDTADKIITDFEGDALGRMKTFCSDDWKVKSLLCVTLIPRFGVMLEKRIATGAGVQPDDSLPSFAAGLLSLRSGVGGRSAHGRLYIPAVPENASSNSRVEGVSLTQLSAIGNALIVRWGPTGTSTRVRYCIYSRKLGVIRHAGPPPWLEFTSAGIFQVREIIARPEIASMRKRQLSRGI